MGNVSFKILILCLVAMLIFSGLGYGLADLLVAEQSELSSQPPSTGPNSTTVPTGTGPSESTAPTGSGTTEPSATDSSGEMTEPSSQETEPSVTVTEPSTTLPSSQTTAPSSTVTGSSSTATEPATAPSTTTAPVTDPTTAPTTVPTTAPTQPPVEIVLSAQNAFVYDLSAEEYLYIFNDLDTPVEPASITKLFSAYVGLQYLPLDAVLTVGQEVEWIDPYSSRADLEPGFQLTMEMCVQAMIIPSGNDAAYTLAVNAGRVISGDKTLSARDAYDVFVSEMNAQAQALGMTGTNFVNPDGMNEDGHYTTMGDMLLMAKLAMETPVIAAAAETVSLEVKLTSGQKLSWENSNLLLHEESEFYCPEAIGLKTGSTSSAGKCLISAFRKGNRILVICVLGCPDNDDRYIDTLALYDLFD